VFAARADRGSVSISFWHPGSFVSSVRVSHLGTPLQIGDILQEGFVRVVCNLVAFVSKPSLWRVFDDADCEQVFLLPLKLPIPASLKRHG